jgi:hypothetical protein
VNTSYVGNINTSYVGAIKTSSVSNNSSTAIASFSQNTTTAESISTSSINTSTMSYYYQFDFMLTNSETNSSQFTSTSVFGTRTSRSPVGYVYVKTKGEASQNQASILETLLNLSASDKGSTTWKTVSRYLGTSPKVVAYSNNGNSFVGNPYINSDDVEYVLHGTCLKEEACTSGEYIETTPSQTGFRFTAATIGSSSDCYNVTCDTGSDYSSTKPTSGTYSTVTYTGASGTTYECYKSNCVNDAKYFEVSLDLSSLSDGDCKIENNKYNRIVPSWRLTDLSGHTTFTARGGTIKSVTSNGKTYTCDESSSIHVSNIKVDMTKCGTEISSGSVSGYDSDYYKFNCDTISGCCESLGGGQLGYPGAQMACTGTNSVSIDTTKSYVSGVTENNSNATVTVCGATLTAGNEYKFTLEGAGGCTWNNKELTVKVTGSSTTATEIW